VTLLVILILGFYFSRNKKDKKRDLIIFRIPAKEVDSVLFGELWILRKAYWPDDSIHKYKTHVKKSNSIFVCFRDSKDGSLRGAYCEDKIKGELENGTKYHTLYMGNLFFYTYYRGTFRLGLEMLKSFAWHWWITPKGTRSFVVFSSMSYKSYVVAATAYPNMYPTYLNFGNSGYDTYKNVSSKVMQHLYPEYWDANSMLIKVHQKFDAAPIRSEMLSDPHIKFFVDHNPEYENGVAIPCIFEVSFSTIIQTIWKVAFGKNKIKKRVEGDPGPEKLQQIRRDLARTHVLPRETKLGNTFNRRHPSKENILKSINKFKKSNPNIIQSLLHPDSEDPLHDSHDTGENPDVAIPKKDVLEATIPTEAVDPTEEDVPTEEEIPTEEEVATGEEVPKEEEVPTGEVEETSNTSNDLK